MANEVRHGVDAARSASAESIPALLSSTGESLLRALIDNPALDETHICVLLKRKDLPGALLEEIARREKWRESYRVRRALAGHPHTPRLVALRLLRDLHLMDLVRISLMLASRGELRRFAEERILAQLPQSPLGQKLMLARRGSARIAGGVAVQGPEQAVRFALDNPFMAESQLLKVLAVDALPGPIVAIIARHEKWSNLINVRLALVRHPHAPLDCVQALAPGLPRHGVEELLGISRIQQGVRELLRRELARRKS